MSSFGFSAAGSGVTNKSALADWGLAVEAAHELGAASGVYSRFKTIGVPESTPLGRWMAEISRAADAGGTCTFDLYSYLRKAKGQLQLASPFGKWAARMSNAMKVCAP